MIALWLALTLATQDDAARLLDQLRGDEFAEREAAQRGLERLGLPVLDKLKAELDKNPELDTKIRLKLLIEKIPKLAQLALVYGPTKRITLQAKDEELDSILKKLEAGLEETIVRNAGLNLKAKVTVSLQDATLWEALDRVATASKTHYEYRSQGIWWFPGQAPALPVVYYEQFRISIGEIKRIEYRSPTEKGALAVVVPEVRYQRNLKPSGPRYDRVYHIESMLNAGGKDVRADNRRPLWANDSVAGRTELVLQESYVVDASGPFSIAGKTTINFAQDGREVVLPMTGDHPEVRTADAVFRLAGTKPDGLRTTVLLEVEAGDEKGPKDRLRGGWLVDAEGKKTAGIILGLHQDGNRFKPELSFPGEIKPGTTLQFRWVTGLHAVEVPFLLREIQVP
jgi:hypothetical protein